MKHIYSLRETHHTSAFYKSNIFETTEATKKLRTKATKEKSEHLQTLRETLHLDFFATFLIKQKSRKEKKLKYAYSLCETHHAGAFYKSNIFETTEATKEKSVHLQTLRETRNFGVK
jgi:hypothetical protein